MGTVSDLDKLQIRLSHWIKHNLEHVQEFRKWARSAEVAGLKEVASRLDAAALEMEQLNRHLQSALDVISDSRGPDG